MRRPVVSGMESMFHSTGEVIEKMDNVLRIRIQSETWNAESTDELQPKDHVEVIGVKGLKLKVRASRKRE